MRQLVHRFDQIVDGRIQRLPVWLKMPMEFFTLIGQPPFTVGIAAAVLGYGAALNKSHYILVGWIAIGTLLLSSILKVLLRRVRPRNEYVASMLFKTFSFPSGHAAGSIVSFGLAALIIGSRWPDFLIVAWIVALTLSFLVGLSRVYLGAHYASDVIGGWIVGSLGLLLIVLLIA